MTNTKIALFSVSLSLSLGLLLLAGCGRREVADHQHPADTAKAPTSKQAEPKPEPVGEDAEILAARATLDPADRALVDAQDFCPIGGERLGSMGEPVKLMLKDQAVFLCCKGCIGKAQREEEQTLTKVQELKAKSGKSDPGKAKSAKGQPLDENAIIESMRAKLDPADRALADAQDYCAVQHTERLGSMGVPVKLTINGQPVFICCKGCTKDAEREPEKTLKKVEELKAKKAGGK